MRTLAGALPGVPGTTLPVLVLGAHAERQHGEQHRSTR